MKIDVRYALLTLTTTLLLLDPRAASARERHEHRPPPMRPFHEWRWEHWNWERFQSLRAVELARWVALEERVVDGERRERLRALRERERADWAQLERDVRQFGPGHPVVMEDQARVDQDRREWDAAYGFDR
jgi:hypothetical protein